MLTNSQIELIKKNGEKQTLGEAIRSKLWNIRQAAELASVDDFAKFKKSIDLIQKTSMEAEQLFNVRSKVSSRPRNARK